jgi:hypothetical protein
VLDVRKLCATGPPLDGDCLLGHLVFEHSAGVVHCAEEVDGVGLGGVYDRFFDVALEGERGGRATLSGRLGWV